MKWEETAEVKVFNFYLDREKVLLVLMHAYMLTQVHFFMNGDTVNTQQPPFCPVY